MSVFPLLVEHAMLSRGCGLTTAEMVRDALEERPEKESRALWLRIQGSHYHDIGFSLRVHKGTAWRIINGPVKNSIYSLLLRAQYATGVV